MVATGGAYWLEHCRKPRNRPQGTDWDVFISYRSANRIWALALYDMLQQAGYKVFLDQYVLAAGSGILSQLSTNLSRSGSGVIVWSNRAAESTWVEREVSAMVDRRDATRGSASPFFFVAAMLDSEPLPSLLSGSLYIDFSTYPDGPTGAELVRLTSGLQGLGLEPPAVERIAQFEQSVREEPSTLRAMVAASKADPSQLDAIRTRALADTPPYTTSATLPALAAQLLISGARYEEALEVLTAARGRFPSSVRLRQLVGLAHRRAGRTTQALLELEKLRADGHQDPETLGILAAAWTDSWRASQNRDELEQARGLYAQAFEHTPSDTYSGINAASKSAMLGEMDRAKELAQHVLDRLQEATARRGGQVATDYWERVTEPEALLLLGRYDDSLRLYHDARIEHQSETGSIRSTAAQLELLLRLVPGLPESFRADVQRDFRGYWPGA
jgi:tetratricopeptide (TPR) repeat protein